MIIRDRNGFERNVEDGQAMTIYNGVVPVDGYVMTFKEGAWLKVNRLGRKELLVFEQFGFVPGGSQRTKVSSHLLHSSWHEVVIPNITCTNHPRNTTPKWEVGSYYRHRTFHERGFMELIHEESDWLTFRRLDTGGHFKNIHTGRKSEHTHLEKVIPPFKSYDPKQQPYDDGDI